MEHAIFHKIVENWKTCSDEERNIMKRHVVNITGINIPINDVLLAFQKKKTSTCEILQLIISSKERGKEQEGWIVYDVNDIRKDPYWFWMKKTDPCLGGLIPVSEIDSFNELHCNVMDRQNFKTIIDNWKTCSEEDRIRMKKYILERTKINISLDKIRLGFYEKKTCDGTLLQMIVSSTDHPNEKEGWIVYDMYDIRKDAYWVYLDAEELARMRYLGDPIGLGA